MNSSIIPFKILPLQPVKWDTEELYCGQKKCCKKFKKGKRCKKCPGRLKMV